METDTGAYDSTGGLVVADGRGRYFMIAWADLERFAVPERYAAAVAALAHGGEPVADGPAVCGFGRGSAVDPSGLLSAALLQVGSGRERPAIRRLRAWMVLP